MSDDKNPFVQEAKGELIIFAVLAVLYVVFQVAVKIKGIM